MKTALTRSFPLIALMLLSLALPALGQTEGQWMIEKRDTEAQLAFRYSSHTDKENYSSNWSNSDDPAKLGIANVINQQGHVQFDIARPAGTFKCEGWMSNGKGSGHFTFAANPQFTAELSKRGLGTPDERQSLKLAIANVTPAYIDTLKKAGYSFDLDELVRTASHGVSEQYLSEMQSAGLKPDSLPELVRMHDHGVSAEYVKELYAAGYKNLSKTEIIRMRDHGVTGDYARELATVGIKDLSSEQIVRMRDHGVSADYVKQLAAAGINGLNPQDIVRMRDHGVSAEFAAAVKRDAYPNITSEQLVRLNDHGVSIDFIRENAKGNSVEDLIRLRNTGAKKRDMM